MPITESGRVNVPLNPKQLEKAQQPISATESGMTKLPLNPEQPKKA